MPDRMIAYCGLVCTECPAYIATRTGDRGLLERTAARWSRPEHLIDPDDILCDGCTAAGRLSGFCLRCEVRSCGSGRDVANCGRCDEYPCQTLERLWRFIKAEAEARPVLEEERRQAVAGRGKPADRNERPG